MNDIHACIEWYIVNVWSCLRHRVCWGCCLFDRLDRFIALARPCLTFRAAFKCRVALIVCLKCRSSLAKLVNWKTWNRLWKTGRATGGNRKLELETKVTGTGTGTGTGTERDWDCNWDWAGASPKRSWERLCNPLLSVRVRAGWHEENAMIDR